MKYLKSFSQLFESSISDEDKKLIQDHIWKQLISRVSFPGIFALSHHTWSEIIAGTDWEDYDKSYRDDGEPPPLSRSAYEGFLESYRQIPHNQFLYDDFVACQLEYVEWSDELSSGQVYPVSWWMNRFHQSQEVASFMKAAYEESVPESIQISWERI